MSSLLIKDKISARLNNLSLLNKNSHLHFYPEYRENAFLSCLSVAKYQMNVRIILRFTDVNQTKNSSSRILRQRSSRLAESYGLVPPSLR